MPEYILNEDLNSNCSLGDVIFLTAPLWVEKLTTVHKKATKHQLVDGTSVLQVFDTNAFGDLITLRFDEKNSIVTAEQAEILQGMAETGEIYAFIYFGVSYNVVFDYSNNSPINLRFVEDGNRAVLAGEISLLRV